LRDAIRNTIQPAAVYVWEGQVSRRRIRYDLPVRSREILQLCGIIRSHPILYRGPTPNFGRITPSDTPSLGSSAKTNRPVTYALPRMAFTPADLRGEYYWLHPITPNLGNGRASLGFCGSASQDAPRSPNVQKNPHILIDMPRLNV
jgi:hypothetical protein